MYWETGLWLKYFRKSSWKITLISSQSLSAKSCETHSGSRCWRKDSVKDEQHKAKFLNLIIIRLSFIKVLCIEIFLIINACWRNWACLSKHPGTVILIIHCHHLWNLKLFATIIRHMIYTTQNFVTRKRFKHSERYKTFYQVLTKS